MNKKIISLKNVSKFYYSKGVIASGFSKVSLDFEMGEFVAITGESGSGKSTLLNVISGLDTYEEGEMYINEEETSHFSEKDFEDYRRKYIGNIFQHFNLVNSYTVYQNIELVLLLNGEKKREIKEKILDLIRQVDLYKFRNTKVSKLSGGQKQRVAIARALAKDTPIIIADEPTGNLDSESSKEIIRLLSEVAKSKLVIIVTHNYDQIEQYVTRKIKMHDGKILEDEIIKKNEAEVTSQAVDYKNVRFFNKIRLGWRNTFNVLPKFLLLFFVFLFVTIATMSSYSSTKKQRDLSDNEGYNYVFQNSDVERVILKKSDLSAFTQEDFNLLQNTDNIKRVVKNDLLLDNAIFLSDNDVFWIDGNAIHIEGFEGSLDLGRMPENENELLIECYDDSYIAAMAEDLIGKSLYFQDQFTGELNTDLPVQVVGIKYLESSQFSYNPSKVYVSDQLMNTISFSINQQYSTIQVLFQNKYYPSNIYNPYFKISPNEKVEPGTAYVSSDLNSYCPNGNCKNQPLIVEVENLYYNETLSLTIVQTYSKWMLEPLLGEKDFDMKNGTIFINPDDYNNLFSKGIYQSSVFVSDLKEMDSTLKTLNDSGFETLAIKNTLYQDDFFAIFNLFRTFITAIFIVVLFFIAYFVISLIMRSRNVYFSTIRMLGANKGTAKALLIIELFIVATLSFLVVTAIVLLNYNGMIPFDFMERILTYLTLRDYLFLYLILVIISLLISIKYGKKLFKKSTMSTLKEEV